MSRFDKIWLSESEARQYTSFCRDTLRKARDENKLPYRMNGRKIIYEKADIDSWIRRMDYHKNGQIRKYK